jgi:hypothetical protein
MYQPHEQRVVDEKKELDIKLEALQDFIENNRIYLQLASNEQVRLQLQFRLMVLYSNVLGERIDYF